MAKRRSCDRVVLRRWKPSTGHGVIALFPEMPEGRGLVNSYEHVGQHGAADYGLVVQRSTPVAQQDPEALDLLRELRTRGYNPCAVRRRPRGR